MKSDVRSIRASIPERMRFPLKFSKMHGIGNDFIIIDAFRQPLIHPERLAKSLCPRRFGVGADGLILALPSAVANARMRIFNADGSEPEMCGNGIRCLGKFLFEQGLVTENPMTVETLAGILSLHLELDGGRVRAVTADMGAPRLAPDEIPVAAPSNRVSATLDGQSVAFFCVSMGNPHAVTFDLYPDDERFRRFGAAMERHPLFPQRANIEFCRLRPDGGVDVRVWERGDGETLACGTGACAVAVAGASLGLTGRDLAVHLPGGALRIRWAEDGRVWMTGPAETVYAGEIDLPDGGEAEP